MAGPRAMLVAAAGERVDSVPVTVLVGDEAPEEAPAESADHVVEVSLRSESGRLRVGAGDEDDDALLPLPAPGSYRVRVSMTGLASADEDDGVDYVIELWPAPESEARVVRWWGPWKPPQRPPTEEGRRTIYGIDEYRDAVQELALVRVSSREVDPPVHLRESLPASYKDSRLLLRAGDGTYWEYSTEAPHHIPLLTELTPPEARRLYGEEVP